MRARRWFPRLAVLALALVVAAQLWAYPRHAKQSGAACVACHVNPAGGAELTAAGTEWKRSGKSVEAAHADGAEYVGSNRCRICHSREHKGWLETGHAKAFENLATAEPAAIAAMSKALAVKLEGAPTESEDCVRCHVVGLGLPGGHPAPDSVRAAGVAHVGCESCHGPGSLHVRAPRAEKKNVIARGGAAMCLECHTKAVDPSFDLESAMKHGVHPLPSKGG